MRLFQSESFLIREGNKLVGAEDIDGVGEVELGEKIDDILPVF